MPADKPVYVTYTEGQEAKRLHLGNLVHDYKNPNDLDPFIEKSYDNIDAAAPFWAELNHLENYALTLGKSPSEDDHGERYQVAAAEKVTKVEIKDPDRFFDNITLKSEEARKWLASRLSAAEVVAEKSKGDARPQIWMLTGLILMTHATWTSLSSKDEAFIPGLPAKFDPNGVSAIRRLSVSDGVKPTFGFRGNEDEEKSKVVSGSVIHETGKYPGTRAWAARWQRVDVEVKAGEKDKDDESQIQLKSGGKVAELELGDEIPAGGQVKKDEKQGGFDEQYWDALLDAADE